MSDGSSDSLTDRDLTDLIEKYYSARPGIVGKVLHWHLILDDLIFSTLEIGYPTIQRNFLERMRFAGRAELLLTSREYTGPMLKPMKQFNKMRNRLAHDMAYMPRIDDLQHVRQWLSRLTPESDAAEGDLDNVPHVLQVFMITSYGFILSIRKKMESGGILLSVPE